MIAPNVYSVSAIGWTASKEFVHRHISRPNPQLKELKNIHMGERCFVVATGPSLTLQDVEKLRDEVTFGVNSIVKLFPYTKWRPTYYCLGDTGVFQGIQNDLLHEMPRLPFFAKGYINCICPTAYWYEPRILEYKLRRYGRRMSSSQIYYSWSNDISIEIASGESIVYTVLQIASYMGFSKIYLLGTDCNYQNTNLLHNKLLTYQYDKQLSPDLGDTMINDYQYAKKNLERNGVQVFNATRGGMLEVFPRVDLDEVLNDK